MMNYPHSLFDFFQIIERHFHFDKQSIHSIKINTRHFTVPGRVYIHTAASSLVTNRLAEVEVKLV